MSARPLIVHVLYRLDTGGMERVLLSVIQATATRYRHAVICLAGSGPLRAELEASATACIDLDKRPGQDWRCSWRLWRQLRRLKPDLVQTYNLGTLDLAPIARLAGVRRVVHAEHGRDAADPSGANGKYRLLRRLMAPFITRFVAVSEDLSQWLRGPVGLRPKQVLLIANGIDTERYHPRPGARAKRPKLGAFAPPGAALIVSVGRLDAVKDHLGLIDAFAQLRQHQQGDGDAHLLIIGDGSERERLARRIAEHGLATHVRLAGNRTDVATLLPECDLFALSSVAEGIPLTVLEAMACGLPVVATTVGGVGEVVVPGGTGTLVPAADPAALAAALHAALCDPDARARHGAAGRQRVQAHFSRAAMVAAYVKLYDTLIKGRVRAPADKARLAGHKES